MELLVLVAVLSTSLILLASGAGHAAGPATFRSRMTHHHVLGSRGVRWAAAVVPVLEVTAGAGALWAVLAPSRAGLVAALLLQTALFGAFAGYLALAVRTGNAGVPCGCGPAEVPVGSPAIARAAGLGALPGVSVVILGALSLSSLPLGPVALRADARGLLAGAAGCTFAVLLMILAPARRLEPLTPPRSALSAGDPTPGRTMIGSA